MIADTQSICRIGRARQKLIEAMDRQFRAANDFDWLQDQNAIDGACAELRGIAGCDFAAEYAIAEKAVAHRQMAYGNDGEY